MIDRFCPSSDKNRMSLWKDAPHRTEVAGLFSCDCGVVEWSPSPSVKSFVGRKRRQNII